MNKAQQIKLKKNPMNLVGFEPEPPGLKSSAPLFGLVVRALIRDQILPESSFFFA